MIYENTLQLMMCVYNEETKEIRIFSSSALNILYANVNQLDAKKCFALSIRHTVEHLLTKTKQICIICAMHPTL